MSENKSNLIMLALSMVPYALFAWLGAEVFADGKALSVAKSLGLLLAARLFFGTIEGIGGILVWRLHGKKIAVNNFLRWLRTNNFPNRYYSDEDFSSYLGRVEDDDALPPSVRTEAKMMYKMLGYMEDEGVLKGVRMHSSSDIALEIYSPKKLAPRIGEARNA